MFETGEALPIGFFYAQTPRNEQGCKRGEIAQQRFMTECKGMFATNFG